MDASGNAYVCGRTVLDLSGDGTFGDYDVFVRKFNSSGNEIWTTQIGTSASDRGHSVAVDASDNVYISGATTGDFGGISNGSSDAFLCKLDSSGDEIWTNQIGTSSTDVSLSVALDASGHVYISGLTKGSLGGPQVGGGDAFLVKYRIPDPATVPPVADADGPYTLIPGNPLTLDASGTVDVDDDIISYMWDLDDDNVYETDAGLATFHVVSYADLVSLGITSGDSYNIKLKVTDQEQMVDIDGTTLYVKGFPLADADGPYTLDTGDPLILNASDSSDVDSDIVSYLWDLNDDGVFETDDAGSSPALIPLYFQFAECQISSCFTSNGPMLTTT